MDELVGRDSSALQNHRIGRTIELVRSINGAEVRQEVKRQIEPQLFTNRKIKSAVDETIDTIRGLLISKQLKPGDKLPSELELAQSLQISRGSIREAMKILSSFGVVRIQQGDGTYVAEEMDGGIFDHLFLRSLLTDIDNERLFELRELMEIGIVRLVVQKATDEDLKRIQEAHQRLEKEFMRGDSSIKALAELDKNFHKAIGEATKNPLIAKIYALTLDLFSPSMEKTVLRGGRGENSVTYHEKILMGLQQRNGDKVIEAIQNSIQRWYNLLDEEG